MRNCWGGGAWPGFEARRQATQHTASATGVKGAGGTGGHGRASRRGAERSEALASRAAGPSGARNTRGATQQHHQLGRPPPTGTPSGPAPQPGPPAPGTPAAPHSNNTGRRRRAGGQAARRPEICRGTSDSSRIYSPARRSTSCMMRPHTALTHATAATPRTRERQGRTCRKSSKP